MPSHRSRLIALTVAALFVAAVVILLMMQSDSPNRIDEAAAEAEGPTLDLATRPEAAARTRPAAPVPFEEPDESVDGSISGRVVAVDGAGIADATVTLSFISGPPDNPIGDSPVTRTDSAGFFRLSSPERWTSAVVARAKGFRSRMTQAVVAGSSGVIITLEPALSLAGRLVTLEGLPVAGGSVRWLGGTTLGESWIATTTDAEGRFQLTDLPVLIDLVATGPGCGRRVLEVWPASAPNPLTIKLSEAVRVRGRVTAQTTGLPIAHSAVELWDWRPSSSRAEGIEARSERLAQTTSDEKGAFVLGGVPEPERLDATNRNAPVLGLWVTAEGLATKWFPLPGSRNILASTLELALPPAACVTGRVLDGSGAPMSSCPVKITTPRGVPLITDVSPQTHLEIVGRAAYYAGRSRMSDPRRIFERQLVTQTDERGQYTFTGLPLTETAAAKVSFVEHDMSETAVTIEIAPDKRIEAPDLVAPAVMGTLSGRVVDKKGAPLDRVLITLGVRNTVSDGAGQFRFPMRLDARATGVPIGATRRGYQPLRRVVDWAMIDSRSVTLILEEGFNYGGFVIDADGAPLAKASVVAVLGTRAPDRAFELVPRNANYEDLVAQTITPATGAFVLRDLPPLCHIIAVYPDMRGPYRATALSVAPRLDLRFQLDVGDDLLKHGDVTFRAADANGTPIQARLRCILRRRGVAIRESSSAGPDTTFVDLPLVDYQLVAMADGYAEVRKDMDLRSGTKEIRITFGGRELRGRITSSEDVAKRGAIGIRSLSGELVAKAVSEDDGTFVVRGLISGTYLIAAEPMLEPNLASDGSPISAQPLRIEAGEAPSRDIDLEVVRAELLCVELRLPSLATTRPVYGDRSRRTKDFVREVRVSIKDPAGSTWFDGAPDGFAAAGVAAKVYLPARNRYDVQVFHRGRLAAHLTGVATSDDPEITVDDATPGPR